MNCSIYKIWGEESARNAVSLAAESRLLFEAQYLPRAYYLAHMSTEESAKSILLFAMSISGTPENELSKISRLLQDHKKKIEFLVIISKKLSEDVQEKFCGLQESLIKHINDIKNDTMYVSCRERSVVTPMEKVETIEIELYVDLAETLSQYATDFLTVASGGSWPIPVFSKSDFHDRSLCSVDVASPTIA